MLTLSSSGFDPKRTSHRYFLSVGAIGTVPLLIIAVAASGEDRYLINANPAVGCFALTAIAAEKLGVGTAQAEAERREVEAVAATLSQPISVVEVQSDQEIMGAITRLADQGARALLVGSGPFLYSALMHEYHHHFHEERSPQPRVPSRGDRRAFSESRNWTALSDHRARRRTRVQSRLCRGA